MVEKYESLADLRQALTSDNSDIRAEAYGAVYENTDLTPTEVLNNDDVEPILQDAGLVVTPEDRPDSVDRHEQIVALMETQNALLERIAVATEGSA